MRDTKLSKTKAVVDVDIQSKTVLPKRILVVDDDNETRQISVDLLTGSGYAVESVKDGAAGWEAFQTNHYDLVVTDNRMPYMTGIEMIARLRLARKGVPIIMATGILPREIIARNPWLQPDATLERPFSNNDLLETVKIVLRRDDNYNNHIQARLPHSPKEL